MQSTYHNTVLESIHSATEYLFAQQASDGHWVAEIEGDTILESEYILLLTFLGDCDKEKLKKAAEYIRRKQLPDGSWAIFHNGPGEVSASIKAYWALKLAGDSPDAPHMTRARRIIRHMGGAEISNSYTRFYLAALGQIPWDCAPAVPPEIMLLPNWFYFNLYEISSWSRTFVVPLSIIWSYRPITNIPPEHGIQELFVRSNTSWPKQNLTFSKRFFLGIDRTLKILDRLGIHPWRRESLEAAKNWMLERFEMSAGLGAIFPPMIYALMALRCLGYPDDDPQVVRARRELEDLAIEEEDTLRLQPCKSPVWDTAIVMNALAAVGVSADHPSLVRATQWIFSKEVRKRGDWSVKRPNLEPGGWYFEYANEFYPDIDDTAMVLLALKKTDPEDRTGACRRALDWIWGMQNRDGGWASFDVDNNRELFCNIPFADHNAMIDPSTSDITARVLEMLAAYGYTEADPRIQKAIQFLVKDQEADGSWFGRWGVNYIYGTWQVIKGLVAIGMDRNEPAIKRAVEWLMNCQHSDGGWGETCQTYSTPQDRGKGNSTASQTAWAVIGLITAGYGDSSAVERGINYLIQAQNSEGTWDEDDWTGTGFPNVFYLKYHLYRHSFPLWAFGMFVSGGLDDNLQIPNEATLKVERGVSP